MSGSNGHVRTVFQGRQGGGSKEGPKQVNLGSITFSAEDAARIQAEAASDVAARGGLGSRYGLIGLMAGRVNLTMDAGPK